MDKNPKPARVAYHFKYDNQIMDNTYSILNICSFFVPYILN